MFKHYGAALTFVLVLVMLCGCGDPIKAPVLDVTSGGNGGGGGVSSTVPGSGGKTAADLNLNTDYNSKPGIQPGMRISALTQGDVNPEEITTQRTLGLWEDGKFHIEGIGVTFNGGYQNAGFVDVLLLYYDQPFEEEFKISARVRINRAGGVSTSKGIHFGAYAPRLDRIPLVEDNDGNMVPNWGANQDSKGFGLFLRAESSPQFRLYYSDQFASTTAGNTALLPELLNISITKEYIYEVARTKIDPALPFSEDNARYVYKLLDSKTYLPVVYRGNPPAPVALPQAVMVPGTTNTPLIQHGVPVGGLRLNAETHPVGGASIQMNPAVRGSVYAGVCISASVAEISQIKIWSSTDAEPRGMDWNYRANIAEDGTITGDGDTPIFATPDTIPAYVPAQNITRPGDPSPSTTVAPTKSPQVINGEDVYTWSSMPTPAQWPALVNANYSIKFAPKPTPDYAHKEIHYQLFPMGTPHQAFFDSDGNIRIQGDSSGSKQELKDADGNVIDEAFKILVIGFDPDKIASGEVISAQFKLVARDLELDENKNAPDYSLLQTLPEYNFRIQITKP